MGRATGSADRGAFSSSPAADQRWYIIAGEHSHVEIVAAEATAGLAVEGLMAYVQGFKHDVFVSYAHADDKPRGGDPQGWVTKLREDLEATVEQFGLREFSVYQDYQGLAPNLPLTGQLMLAMEESAVLLLILSPAYIESEWCQREKNAFLGRIDPSSGRVFVAERRPPGAEPVPPELEELLRLRFYAPGTPPNPLDPFDKRTDDKFLAAVEKLGYHLERQLRAMNHLGVVETAAVPMDPKERTLIFMAEVPPDLDRLREQMKTSLDQFGIDVVPRDYYQEQDAELRPKVEEDLERCDIFVQILGGSPDPRARLQFDCAVEAGKKMFVWRDPRIPLERVRDPEYLRFLRGEHVRAESLNSFQKTVREEALKPPPPPPPPPKPGSYVFVHMDEADRSLAEAILRVLSTHQAEGILASAEDVSAADVSAEQADAEFKDELTECSALILVRGQNDRWVTATWRRLRKMLPEVMTRRIEHGQGDLHIALFDRPPPEKGPPPVVAPNLHILDCREDESALDRFLDELLGGSG